MRKVLVNLIRHLAEIMNNFTHPLEVLREAIQNSLDALAQLIIITIQLIPTESGISTRIVIEDDGESMSPEEIEHFFNLADSTKAGKEGCIGYKGNGTKIYYHSDKITLEIFFKAKKYVVTAENPYAKLFNGQLVEYSEPVEVPNTEGKQTGVRITIDGYLKNTADNYLGLFSHPCVKDYIIWSTAFGSVRGQFEKIDNPPTLLLRTYDSDQQLVQQAFGFSLNPEGFEEIPYGHVFPKKELTDKSELKALAAELRTSQWEQLYCKKAIASDIFVDGLAKPIKLLV